MNKFFEVHVQLIIENGKKEKKVKEVYLVDAQSVTEAEKRVVKDFVDAKVSLDFKVVSAKESKIVRVIES